MAKNKEDRPFILLKNGAPKKRGDFYIDDEAGAEESPLTNKEIKRSPYVDYDSEIPVFRYVDPKPNPHVAKVINKLVEENRTIKAEINKIKVTWDHMKFETEVADIFWQKIPNTVSQATLRKLSKLWRQEADAWVGRNRKT